ncbi:MAG: patatin-like phospholipase family protein [Pseudomonadota bacterium]
MRRQIWTLPLLAGLSLILAGCTTIITRQAVPEDLIDKARPYGIDSLFVRAWGDIVSDEQVARLIEGQAAQVKIRHADKIANGETIEWEALALSGGGPDGAFGAGYLAGWAARGDRPVFEAVSGVSTGAIIALYAFLGPEYDDDLREIYTTYDTDDLVTPALFTGITRGTALLDASGYRALIERYIDDEIVAALAKERTAGRILMVGTTNLDASRPVVWNLTAIAASGHPDAKRLIHDVIQASSAIPGAFPPVLIPVEHNGRRYDEMHVDGGATQQVMLFSPRFSARRIDEQIGAEIDRRLYVIINNKLTKPYQPVRPRLGAIASRSASSLIGGSGTGDLYRIFAIAERDGAEMSVIQIPQDFDVEPEEAFDPVYMSSLYDLGFRLAVEGEAGLPHPPDWLPGAAGDTTASAAVRAPDR